MRRPRRFTAAFLLLLLLHSMGLGSGLLSASSAADDCAATMAHTDAAAADAGGMAGMPMPAQSPSPDEHGPDAPCGLPWALGCTSAAACLPLVLPAAVAHDAEGTPVQASISAAYMARPASLVRVPEPPPPRG